MPKIGLITVLFNSNNVLEGFFRSLALQTFTNYHLYIFDNSPSPTTTDYLQTLKIRFPSVTFSHQKSGQNIGFSKANNICIETAIKDGCEYLLLLNNDIEFTQRHLIESMVSQAETQNENIIVPKIIIYNTKKIWMAGAHFQWWKAMAYHIGENKSDDSRYNRSGYYNFAPACFVLFRASIFENVGMIDEKYFVYFEDTDFFYRASKSGYKIFYSPELKILHKVSSSTGGYNSIFSIYYGNRNRIYFIRKHFGPIKKIIAYSFVFSSRVFKYIGYDAKQRHILLKAIKDGFAMNLH